MQLDRTHIAIRVRSLSEIGDLALLMLRRYPVAVTRAFFAGAAPWIVINAILLSFLPMRIAADEFFTDDSLSDLIRYASWMSVLVVLQTPLAGAFSTFYLGQAVFEQKPTLRHTFAEVWKLRWPLLWILGVKRLAIPTTLLLAFRIGTDSDIFLDFVLPWLIVILAAIIRSNRPFVPEMIVLERCPLRSRSSNVITLARRSKGLHGPMSSELGGRFLTVAGTSLVLTCSVYYSMIWVRGIATSNWSTDFIAMVVFLPLALWIIAAFTVVVRLLGYLDARIRLEGWEVELAIRAEAIRQFGEDAMTGQSGSSRPRLARAGSRLRRPTVTPPPNQATEEAILVEESDSDVQTTPVEIEVRP
ncbi:putative transmembrane region and signal peptide protein [Rhodopirellula islandica]|uniref:Transmembrane region and signal peptide protein n=1 Tax=Rhodopirellula islandica TaxID=595434 RepID=A0A0J1EEZ1_RHOIS|nr:hypothetical protein [Rhodopirellula islandica]KLU04099.1 putative transmembrane region and signal peptide protein [Rhodopirellula islandica]